MWPLVRVIVSDTSMQPALRPGDRLLAARWRTARPGEIVLFRDPEAARTLLVKRVVARTQQGHLSVQGDNPNVSRDSRHFGPVPPAFVIGTIVYRYFPAARRGRL